MNNHQFRYKVTLTRYKDHERRLNPGNFIHASSFVEATYKASSMCEVMHTADPDAVFEITYITCEGYYGATECVQGTWFTEEEFSARVEQDEPI